jgi:hypothetical protein
MAEGNYRWKRRTMAATFERISETPSRLWVALGDFLDDWRRSERNDRGELVQEPIGTAGDDLDLHRRAA